MLKDWRLSFVIFIGKDPKEQPEKSRVINAHQNPSHFNNSKRRLVVFCNHYIYFFVVPKAKTPKQGKINKRFMEYGYSHPKKKMVITKTTQYLGRY